jgi:hypothetical protein
MASKLRKGLGMDIDPREIALREITETERMVRAFLASSGSFDYVRAKAVVEELRLKMKLLGWTKAAPRVRDD